MANKNSIDQPTLNQYIRGTIGVAMNLNIKTRDLNETLKAVSKRKKRVKIDNQIAVKSGFIIVGQCKKIFSKRKIIKKKKTMKKRIHNKKKQQKQNVFLLEQSVFSL